MAYTKPELTLAGSASEIVLGASETPTGLCIVVDSPDPNSWDETEEW